MHLGIIPKNAKITRREHHEWVREGEGEWYYERQA